MLITSGERREVSSKQAFLRFEKKKEREGKKAALFVLIDRSEDPPTPPRLHSGHPWSFRASGRAGECWSLEDAGMWFGSPICSALSDSRTRAAGAGHKLGDDFSPSMRWGKKRRERWEAPTPSSVLPTDPPYISDAKSTGVPVGQKGILMCEASAVPSADFQWYKDDKR